MTACPECGTTLPTDANFCRNCGSSIRESCPSCGTTVGSNADYCPGCGEALGNTDTSSPAPADKAVQLGSREFARRVDGPDIKASGILNRLRQKEQVKIEAGNRALLLKEGSLVGEIGPGKHTLDSLGQKLENLRTGRDYTVVLVADGPTTVTLQLDAIRTAADYPIGITIELAVSIDAPERFFTQLMGDRDTVMANTFERLLGNPIRDELEAIIAEYEPDELYGNLAVKEQIREAIETRCQQTFARNGLTLVELRSFDYDDDRDEIRDEKKRVQIRREREDLKDEDAALDRRERERETEDAVHEEQQRVRRETTSQSADHEIETQEIEHEHEKDDMERRHEHRAERENVEHEQSKKTTRKEGEVDRRELEHEQDMEEMEDLVDLKQKKDQRKLDREEREQDLEMRKDRHEAEVEKERLQARDDVDLETLASMDDVDEAVAELAEIEKAEDLTPEQLEALGAKDSDELAKARQEAHNAETERERVADQKEFREEMKDMMDDSMDRMQETTESAMDNMGETGRAAAEDTADNVIVSDSGNSGSDGDTTIVQGGGGGNGSDSGSDSNAGTDGSETVVTCPTCDDELPSGNDFCINCGTEL